MFYFLCKGEVGKIFLIFAYFFLYCSAWDNSLLLNVKKETFCLFNGQMMLKFTLTSHSTKSSIHIKKILFHSFSIPGENLPFFPQSILLIYIYSLFWLITLACVKKFFSKGQKFIKVTYDHFFIIFTQPLCSGRIWHMVNF